MSPGLTFCNPCKTEQRLRKIESDFAAFREKHSNTPMV